VSDNGEKAVVDPIGDPEAGRRRLVEIRCGFADLASKEADAAHDRASEARGRYDEQLSALARAQAALDKAATVKERARRAYRASLVSATERVQVEASAMAWLRDINRINGQIRVAQARMEHKREVAEALLVKADKLSMTAEASRAMADAALEACRAARQALGLLGEGMPAEAASPKSEAAPAPRAKSRAKPAPSSEPVAVPEAAAPAPTPTAPEATPVPPPPAAAASVVPAAASPAPAGARLATDWLAVDLRLSDAQAIVRLLRRDRATLGMLVDELADVDPSARRSWQLLLSTFVDAVAAAAIDDAFFEFPPGNPFWDLFKPDEGREVARGLAALGFRYDGFGEFADGRVPAQRDLAFAVGAAGLLPVRIRFWPNAAETAELFRNVRVATEVFVAQRAPSLTLGETVRLLGRRAEQLADLWNEWPRVRPLLLTASGY
jgi:hypothetical protein